MTLNYIVLILSWSITFMVTVLLQRTIKQQTRANDLLLDDIATLENKNDLLKIELINKENDLEDMKDEIESEQAESNKWFNDFVTSSEHVEELENLLKKLDPDKPTIDFDDGLKPYPSTVKEVVDRHVK